MVKKTKEKPSKSVTLRLPISLYKIMRKDADFQYRTLTSVIVKHLEATYISTTPSVKTK